MSLIYTFEIANFEDRELNRYLSIAAKSEDEAKCVANDIMKNNYYVPLKGIYKKLKLVNISPVILINNYYRP